MDALTLLALLGYAASTSLYLAVHLGGGESAARLGRAALAVACLLELADVGLRCFRLQHPLSSTAEATAFVAWLLSTAFFLASLRYRLEAAGAFVVPSALLLLLLARVLPAEGLAPGVSTPLGTTHVLLATLGLAAFALAAALAVLYLVQERRLKGRHFNPRERRPPLETLDRLAARCVSFGFPVLTLTILTGALWVARLGLLQGAGQGRSALRPEYLLSLASWIAFAALLLARVVAGWQGRRTAWLTLGGFAGSLLVLVGYVFRHMA